MKKVVPKLRQEVKVKVDIVTSDDIKIYYTGKFQDFTARYIMYIFHWLILFYLYVKKVLLCRYSLVRYIPFSTCQSLFTQ